MKYTIFTLSLLLSPCLLAHEHHKSSNGSKSSNTEVTGASLGASLGAAAGLGSDQLSGAGNPQFKTVPNWAKMPENKGIGPTHGGVVVDSMAAYTGQTMQEKTEAESKPEKQSENNAAMVRETYLEEVNKLQAKYPGVLAWVSQSDAELTLNTAGMRSNFKDDDLKNFKPLAALFRQVDLTAADITDASAPILSEMTSLESLQLPETKITDQSISSIVSLKELKSLNLYGTTVTDAGVIQLAAMPQLKHLYLWQSQVTQDGVKALQVKLPECEITMGIQTH